jgi:hypothetical protein
MSSAYNHVRSKRGKDERSMAMFIRKEVEHQERLEAAGYRSPTWRVLRALQSLLSATQLQGEGVAPPFFPNAGRGTVRFWGNEQRLTVFLWDGLDEEGREECERTIQTRKDWVVWEGFLGWVFFGFGSTSIRSTVVTGQTEGLKVGCGGMCGQRNGWIGGWKDGYKGGVWV